jgi:leucyl/phenylalanyl-tRNA--protein transferase
MVPLDPDLKQLIARYRQGDFPMAASRDDPGYDWFNPPVRGILPIAALTIVPELADMVLSGAYEVRINSDFDRMVAACAAPGKDRSESWINPAIEKLFQRLHRAGLAHSVECWQGGDFAGGLYGLHPGGGVFCGESMVSLRPRASAVALVHLCARLWAGGFTVLDCQMVTPHTARLGAQEIPQHSYLALLQGALKRPAAFPTEPLASGAIRAFIELCAKNGNS